MFPVGTIVNGPFPAMEKGFNVWNHFLVVLQSDARGCVVMLTDSLKEFRGGVHTFSESEREAARLPRPTRFNANRIAFFKLQDLRQLKATQGKLSAKSVNRLIEASIQAKAEVVTFVADQPWVDSGFIRCVA